ncbi:MAG: tRNA (5-methylaminomethyl-2-thiouridine)(34)-methyltransferase MnmD [Candidatus Puniceispirillaceae bacterium]
MSPASPHRGASYDLPMPNVSFDAGIPYAGDFEDGYYGGEDGLAEARHVFLDGNDLAARCAGNHHLTIAETGFGTGLNCLAVMALLERCPTLQLDYISVEQFPMTPDQMRSSHGAFPELERHAAALRRAMPPRWPGYHMVPLCDGRLTLHLHYGEIGATLPQLDFLADAWFLDGFAPSRNPGMWSPDILEHVGRLARPGGTLASFTAAGHVRRGLEAAGFIIARRPGFGRKREMITGVRSGDDVVIPNPPQRVAVIGGGIAGASVAAGLRRRGCQPVILDAGPTAGSGASGNRMALQSPKLTVDHNPMSQLSAACLSWASRLSDLANATVGEGVVAFDAPARMAARHEIFRTQQWPPDLLMAGAGGYEIPGARGGPVDQESAIHYMAARAIMPATLLAYLLGGLDPLYDFAVDRIAVSADGLDLHAGDGRQVSADAAVIAAGADMSGLLAGHGHDLPFETTHGLVSQVPTTDTMARLDRGISFGGYLTPALDGRHDLGATFWRDRQMTVDAASIAAGHSHNLGLLASTLGAPFGDDPAIFGARVSRRASLPDRRPIAGQLSGQLSGRLADRLFILGGLGARGFTTAPLLGDLLAGQILGRPVPLARSQWGAIQAARYEKVPD